MGRLGGNRKLAKGLRRGCKRSPRESAGPAGGIDRLSPITLQGRVACVQLNEGGLWGIRGKRLRQTPPPATTRPSSARKRQALLEEIADPIEVHCAAAPLGDPTLRLCERQGS